MIALQIYQIKDFLIILIRSLAVWDMTCSPGRGACAEAQGGVEASWVDLFVHAERNQRGT